MPPNIDEPEAWQKAATATLSAVLPKTSDLSSLRKDGNPHAGASFLITIATGIAVMVPAAILGVTIFLAESWWLATLFTSLWAIFSAVTGVGLLIPVSHLVGARRENLSMVARGS